MNGILIIDKPIGLSSHDCVSRIRKTYRTKKVGHSGTLDVEASGVLVLGINKGTKLLNYLNQDDKHYHFTLRLGASTDTLDHTGTRTGEAPVGNLERFDEVLASFKGVYLQTPPDYSAVKVQGRKLYEYAREGSTVPQVPPRTIVVHHLHTKSGFSHGGPYVDIDIEVEATKGIYVRALAADIAEKLGTLGHTTAIRRLRAGDFTLDEAIKLETITAETPIIPMAEALKGMPAITVSTDEIARIKHGNHLELRTESTPVKLLDSAGELLAIYEKHGDIYKAKNVFI